MSEMTIEVQSRDEEVGSGAARRLRRAGMIPAVVYGGDRESKAITVPRRALIELLKKGGRENAVFLLKLAGSDKQRNCMVKELEVDPISREILHVDFLRIDMAAKVEVSVHVELLGEPLGVRNEGGILDHVNREVEVSCLPGDIPRQLELDVSGLRIGDHVAAGDLTLPDGVELLTEPDRVLASVVAPRLAEEPEEEEEALLIEAEQVEPEVVGRGKAEEGAAGGEGEAED
jgi:large subunit ribosomal protein L25